VPEKALKVSEPTVVLDPSVTVPPVPLLPKMADEPEIQVEFTPLSRHWLAFIQVPAPSVWLTLAPLASHETLAPILTMVVTVVVLPRESVTLSLMVFCPRTMP
jgi:hypothetical protein